MTRVSLIVFLVFLAMGCITPPRATEESVPNVWVISGYPLEVAFDSCRAAFKDVGAEVVSSEIQQHQGNVVAHRQAAGTFYRYTINLSKLSEQIDDIWTIVLTITVGDTSEMIDPKDQKYAEYWAALKTP